MMIRPKVLENSVQVASMARQAGARILHCPISFQPGHEEISNSPYGILKDVKGGACFTAGTWGADICSAMMPHSGDLVVKGKSGLCGFESTNLEFLLRQHGIQTIVLAGFLTNCCVESTMRTAYEKGFKVYTLKDCTAATSIEAHQSTLEHNFGMFSIPTTSGNIISALKR
jgi:biuret amidohydrolase